MIIKRIFDICFSITVLTILLIPIFCIALAVFFTSEGPIIFWSDRVGKNNKIFKMPKFRSMRIETPEVASNLLCNPTAYFTPIGSFLRKTSLDELPQLFSILIGDMSVVGPRPALFNENELIYLRTINDVHTLNPGLTGWAQINGRDELTVTKKVILDRNYFERQSFVLDIKIIFLTVIKVLLNKNVSH